MPPCSAMPFMTAAMRMLADAVVQVAAGEVLRRAMAASLGHVVLFERVRSAEPPTRFGHRAASASAPCRERLAGRDLAAFGSAISASSQRGLARRPSAARRHRRRELGAARRCRFGGQRCFQASASGAARAGGAPGARDSSGTSKGACGQPSVRASAAISSAPSGAPCAAALPCLVGRAVADDGPAGDQRRACRDRPAPPRWRARDRRRGRGRRPLRTCQP